MTKICLVENFFQVVVKQKGLYFEPVSGFLLVVPKMKYYQKKDLRFAAASDFMIFVTKD